MPSFLRGTAFTEHRFMRPCEEPVRAILSGLNTVEYIRQKPMVWYVDREAGTTLKRPEFICKVRGRVDRMAMMPTRSMAGSERGPQSHRSPRKLSPVRQQLLAIRSHAQSHRNAVLVWPVIVA